MHHEESSTSQLGWHLEVPSILYRQSQNFFIKKAEKVCTRGGTKPKPQKGQDKSKKKKKIYGNLKLGNPKRFGINPGKPPAVNMR